MPGMGDDMSDDDMGDMGPPPDELPDGVKKEIITEGQDYKKPKPGDEVTVHYVGTLEADGTEFDSSRGRGDPFVFTLGKGDVIKGWDVGVATMKKGETAKFTLSSEFAYGDTGSPPKIPGGATLVFEVELLSWVSMDDLFGDEGCIKSLLVEGSGWKKPRADDEVLIDLKVTAGMGKDGMVVEEKNDFEYVVGSDVLSGLGKTVDKALTDMKKGEEVSLACKNKDYACGEKTPDGAIISLILKQMYETKDVSYAKDKSLMKKQIAEGEGYDMPKDCAKVKVQVDSATDGTKALAGFTPATLEFTVGNGEVCDALECAVEQMKSQEKAVLTGSDSSILAEEKLGLKDLKAEKVVLTMQLLDMEKAQDTWNMSEDEKIAHGLARKDMGTNLFKKGRFRLALERYRKVIALFNYIDNMKEENKTKAKELKKTCELNSASCQLRFKDYVEAKKHCDNVLKEDRVNAKALFRHAQANLGLKNYQECIATLKSLPDSVRVGAEARNLLKEAQAGQKEEDKKSKGLFANMCKALGKGPIPPPGVSKPAYGDEDDDDEFDDEPPAAEAGAAAEAAPPAEGASGEKPAEGA